MSNDVPHLRWSRAPIARILSYGSSRDWRNLKRYADHGGDSTRDWFSSDDAEPPGYNVLTRSDGAIHHFCDNDGSKETTDSGPNPHVAPDMPAL